MGARASELSELSDLIARGQNRDSRSPDTSHFRHANSCQQARFATGQHVAGVQDQLTGGDVGSAKGDVRARDNGAADQ